MSDEADIIEVCDTIESLAHALAFISEDSYVDAKELEKSVLETFGDRLPPHLRPVVRRHSRDAAYYIGSKVSAEREMAELEKIIRPPKRTDDEENDD